MIRPGSKKGGSRAADMTEGAVWPLLITFAVPVLLGNLFQMLYNTVDSIMVGRLVSTSALAAVSSTTTICNTVVKFFNGVSLGANVIASQNFGGKRYDALQRTIRSTMSFTFVCCIVLTVLGLSASRWILESVSTPEDVMPDALLYLQIYFCGLSGLLLYNMGSAILRAVGDTRSPLNYLFVSSLVNIVLDYIFIAWLRLGIAGASAATVISQFISAFLVMRNLWAADSRYRFRPGPLLFDRRILLSVFAVGLPVGLQQGITAFSNVFIQAYINSFGAACIAGWGCYVKLDQYLLTSLQSLGQAATTFAGQNIGAGKPERANEGTGASVMIGLLLSVIVSSVLLLFSSPLVGLFSRDPDVITYGNLFMGVCVPFAFFCAFTHAFSGALRGRGLSRVPMLITLFACVAGRQSFVLAASLITPLTPRIVGFSYPVGWFVNAGLTTLYYFLVIRKEKHAS